METREEKVRFIEEFEKSYYRWVCEGKYLGILIHEAKKLVDKLKVEINYYS